LPLRSNILALEASWAACSCRANAAIARGLLTQSGGEGGQPPGGHISLCQTIIWRGKMTIKVLA